MIDFTTYLLVIAFVVPGLLLPLALACAVTERTRPMAIRRARWRIRLADKLKGIS